MDKIQEIIESLGLDQDKAEELMATAKTNPMAAMGMLGSLGITPEKLQTLMQLVMQNPDLLKRSRLSMSGGSRSGLKTLTWKSKAICPDGGNY